jgi:hypothetical protein
MDEEYREDTKGPVVNGHAVPVRDTPQKSSPPVPRLQAMDSDDYLEENGDTILQDVINEEEDTAGPLIPPPQGFRSPGHTQGRALSQSVPQVNNRVFYSQVRKPCICRLKFQRIWSIIYCGILAKQFFVLQGFFCAW